MHPILRVLADNVKARRLRLGLTHAQLSEGTGISVRSLERIESARSNPGIDIVFRIARALDVEPADLLREPRQHTEKRRLH